MKNHSIQFSLWWTPFEIKQCTIEIISKYYIVWNNTGPNFIYFSTSSFLSLGQIELIKYLQFSFTLASSNSDIRNKEYFTGRTKPLVEFLQRRMIESKEKHGVCDPKTELTINSPYVHSRVDSNTFTRGQSYARVDLKGIYQWEKRGVESNIIR